MRFHIFWLLMAGLGVAYSACKPPPSQTSAAYYPRSPVDIFPVLQDQRWAWGMGSPTLLVRGHFTQDRREDVVVIAEPVVRRGWPWQHFFLLKGPATHPDMISAPTIAIAPGVRGFRWGQKIIRPSSATAIDINGDGALDLVIGYRTGRVAIFFGDGHGKQWTLQHVLSCEKIWAFQGARVYVGHWDGDRHLDLVVTGQTGHILLWRQRRPGQFSPQLLVRGADSLPRNYKSLLRQWPRPAKPPQKAAARPAVSQPTRAHPSTRPAGQAEFASQQKKPMQGAQTTDKQAVTSQAANKRAATSQAAATDKQAAATDKQAAATDKQAVATDKQAAATDKQAATSQATATGKQAARHDHAHEHGAGHRHDAPDGDQHGTQHGTQHGAQHSAQHGSTSDLPQWSTLRVLHEGLPLDLNGDGVLDLLVAGSDHHQRVWLWPLYNRKDSPGAMWMGGPRPLLARWPSHNPIASPKLLAIKGEAGPTLVALTSAYGYLNSRGVAFVRKFRFIKPSPPVSYPYAGGRQFLVWEHALSFGLTHGRFGLPGLALVTPPGVVVYADADTQSPRSYDLRRDPLIRGRISLRGAIGADLEGTGQDALIMLGIGAIRKRDRLGVHLLIHRKPLLPRPRP